MPKLGTALSFLPRVYVQQYQCLALFTAGSQIEKSSGGLTSIEPPSRGCGSDLPSRVTADSWHSVGNTRDPLFRFARYSHYAILSLYRLTKQLSSALRSTASLTHSSIRYEKFLAHRNKQLLQATGVIISWCTPTLFTLIPPAVRGLRRVLVFTIRPLVFVSRRLLSGLLKGQMRPTRGLSNASRSSSRKSNGTAGGEMELEFMMPCVWEADNLAGE